MNMNYRNIVPFQPVYCRPPNKLLGYREEPFDDGYGHTATLRIAIFQDKSKAVQETVAQVIWNVKKS